MTGRLNRSINYLTGHIREPNPYHVEFDGRTALAKLYDLRRIVPSAGEDLCLFAKLFAEEHKKGNYGFSPSSLVRGVEALAYSLRASPGLFGAEYQGLTGKKWFEYEPLCNDFLEIITQHVIPEGFLTKLELRSSHSILGFRTKSWLFDFTTAMKQCAAAYPIQIEHGIESG